MSSMKDATAKAFSILLVDDDETFRERLARALRGRDLTVWTAGTLTSAVEIARDEQPEFAVVDMRMPDTTGNDVLEAVASVSPATKMVILTGYGSISSAVESMRRGADHYLSKPLDADELLTTLAKLRNESEPSGAAQANDEAPTNTPSLARAEWEHIQRVLGDVNGNISETARRLGIARRTLQLKLKKYPPRT